MADFNTNQVDCDETTPLIIANDIIAPITDSNRIASWLKNHKKKLILVCLFIAILILIALLIYFVIFYGRSELIVFEFNVWGMPGGIGDCQYKKERMRALANIIRSREPYFDIFMMAELWMEDDHALLMEAANETGLYMTGFRELASSFCDGRVLITQCSGLAIISIYPIKTFEFHQYTWKGTIWDGEALAGKGVGRIQIEPQKKPYCRYICNSYHRGFGYNLGK